MQMIVHGKDIKKEFIRKKSDTNVFTAVSETDISLEPGKLTVITGRSGSGKSTLLNMLSGILVPDSGGVYYDDISIYEMNDRELSRFRNRNTGYIPQGSSAVASLNVKENILLPVMYCAEGIKVDDRELMEMMERLSVSELAGVMPDELSGGELRRMAVARALILRPSVIFADEPTGDLDDENTAIVFTMLREAADAGACVLLVTHESGAAEYADVMYRMEAGRLGSCDDL